MCISEGPGGSGVGAGRPLSEGGLGGARWSGPLALTQGRGVAWRLHFRPAQAHRSPGTLPPRCGVLWACLVCPLGLVSSVPRAKVWDQR